MSEIFTIQENSDDSQESKIIMDESGENTLFNKLHALGLSDASGHKEIKSTIAELKSTLDDFNIGVDNNLLLGGRFTANKSDQSESYNTAKKTTSENLQLALESKVSELNSVIEAMENDYSNDTEELKGNIGNLLGVNSFTAAIPKTMFYGDGKKNTPADIQLAQNEAETEAFETAKTKKERLERAKTASNMIKDIVF